MQGAYVRRVSERNGDLMQLIDLSSLQVWGNPRDMLLLWTSKDPVGF